MSAAVREGEVEAMGFRSPTLEAGPPDADEAVVFVHGNPGSRRDWEHLLPLVGAHGRALALDMPGFGEADKPRDTDYSVGSEATFLAAALDALGIRRAHLVLHDFGGPWGLLWAAAHPEAFLSAVLIDTGVFVDYRWHFFARLWRVPLLGELLQLLTTATAFRLSLKWFNPSGLPREFVDRMYSDYDRDTRHAVLRMYRASPENAMARLVPTFRALDRPALVVWGERDRGAPVEQAERQRLSFPSAEVVVFDGCGHWPMAEQPDRLAAAVLPFLQDRLAR